MIKNKCSLKVVKKGKRLNGTAAILHMISREGGLDKWLEDYTEKIAKDSAQRAITDLFRSQAKPQLEIVVTK